MCENENVKKQYESDLRIESSPKKVLGQELKIEDLNAALREGESWGGYLPSSWSTLVEERGLPWYYP